MSDPIELHAWADGEVPREREAAVRQALTESAEAKAELESILLLKSVLRDKVSAVESAEAWSACVGRLNEIDRTRRVERFTSGKFAWGLSGLLFGVVILAGFLHRGSTSTNVNSAEIARVLGTFSHASRPTTTPSDNDNTTKLLAIAKASIDPHRLSFLGEQFEEVDGRVWTRYLWRDASGDFNLFTVPEFFEFDVRGITTRDHTLWPVVLNGVNGVAWNNGSGTHVLTANRSLEDLTTLASGFN